MAQTVFITELDIDDAYLKDKLDRLCNDKRTMLEVHNLFAKMMEPYVPFAEGKLAQTTEITPEYVRYTQPYAHYQYTGLVYGPNVPIIENGMIVGWFSPIKPKHPTGKELQYSKEVHPLASKEWDKAMMAQRGDEFVEQVKDILVRRAREIYG